MYALRLALLLVSLHSCWPARVCRHHIDHDHRNYTSTQICSALTDRTLPNPVTRFRFCEANPDAMCSSLVGWSNGVRMCESLMKAERWNCSALRTVPENHYYHKLLTSGYKQTSMARVILIAAQVQQLAVDCLQGQAGSYCSAFERYHVMQRHVSKLKHKEPTALRKSYNVPKAQKYVQRLLVHHGRDQRTTMQRTIDDSNTKLALKLVRNLWRNTVKCRCHGISGSCTIRYCHMIVSAESLALRLRRVWSKSLRLNYSNEHKLGFTRPSNHTGLAPNHQPTQTHTESLKLWKYLLWNREDNFCGPVADINYPGVSARRCYPDSNNTDSCDLLCCGRGYDTINVTYVYTNATFKWCCEIIETPVVTWQFRQFCK